MKKITLSLLCCFFLFFQTHAADFYWVGGSGDWNDLIHWATVSGGNIHPVAVPSSADNVFFDGNSFSAAGQKVSLTTDVTCNNMIWTGVTNNPVLEFSLNSNNRTKIYGSLKLSSSMSMSYLSVFGGRWEFWSTSLGNTITTAGNQMSDVSFRGDGGSWTLQDNFSANQQIAVFYGILNTNNVTINTGTFLSDTGCGGCNIRTINLGSSVINCATLWNIFGDPGMILNAGTSTIRTGQFESRMNNAVYNNVEMNGSGINSAYLNGNVQFNNFDFTAGASLEFIGEGNFTVTNRLGLDLQGATTTFVAGSLITVNGLLKLPNPGPGCSALTTLQTWTSGSPVTITKSGGNVGCSRMILKDIAVAGGAVFIANQSIDQGGNSGWTINAPAAATYYWIGGTGNWNDGNHWALSSGGAASGCTPSLTDNVFFDANSFSSAGQKVSLTTDVACNNMSWTGVTNNPVLEFSGNPNNRTKIYGSLTLVSGMSTNYVYASGGIWEFWSTSPGNTITTAGRQMSNVSFRGDGGSWTLQDNFSANQQIAVFYGTLNTNNVTINTGTFLSDTGCGGCNIRTINLGSSVVNCATLWNIFGDPGMILNTGTSTIRTGQFESRMNNAVYNNVEMNGSGVNSAYLNGNVQFNNFDFTTGASLEFIGEGNFIVTNRLGLDLQGATTTFVAGSLITVNGLLKLPNPGSACSVLTTLQTSASGSPATIHVNSGNVLCSRMIIKDIAATGATFTANQSIDQGGNSGLTFSAPTPATYYWIGGTGNWNDGNHWALSSGGAASGCTPALTDNVFFDANSFSGAGQKVSLTTDVACRNMNWTGVTNNPVLEFSSNPNNRTKIYGNLTLVSGMSTNYVYASGGIWEFWSTSPGNTITTGGRQMSNVRFLGDGGSWTLQDNFSANQQIDVFYGTLKTNNVTINTGTFLSTTGCGGCNIRTVNLGSSVINCSTEWNIFNDPGMTLNTGTSVINAASFRSASQTYNNVAINGNTVTASLFTGSDVFNNLTISSTVNTYFNGSGPMTINNSFIINGPAKTISINPLAHINLNGSFTVNSSATNIINLQSSFSGQQAFINKSTGRVCIDNVILQDMNAGGGAAFFASNSTDNGNNSGWIFSSQSCLFILPVELLSFDVVCTSGNLVFNWKTAMEINSSHFEIQRLVNTNWITIGTMPASGQSNSERSYRFPSAELEGTYRLVSADRDGNQSYSDIKTAQCAQTENIMIIPNPVHRELEVRIKSTKNEQLQLQIINSLGQVVRIEEVVVLPGINQHTFNLSALPAGKYVLSIPSKETRIPFLKIQ